MSGTVDDPVRWLKSFMSKDTDRNVVQMISQQIDRPDDSSSHRGKVARVSEIYRQADR